MKKLSVFVLLCTAPVLASCQQSTKDSTSAKPDSGSFAQNTYRNDFFRFSYTLPKEWHKSRVLPSPLPSGAYYLFIGDRDTGHALLNRVTIVADPENNSPAVSCREYVSAFIRAQIRDFHAELPRTKNPSFSSGGSDFDRTDYTWVNDGTIVYSSFVCSKRNRYWLDWNFTAPSQQDLDDAVNTLHNIAFDHTSAQSR